MQNYNFKFDINPSLPSKNLSTPFDQFTCIPLSSPPFKKSTMVHKNNKPLILPEQFSMQNLFAEMGIPGPKENLPSVKEEPSLKELLEHDGYKCDNAKPKVLLDVDNDSDRFCIMDLIGTSFDGSLPVYKAAYMALHNDTYDNMTIQDVFVAVKCVNIDQEPEVCSHLKQQVEMNCLIPDHKNLMGIRKPFIHDGYFCVVFPLMELGSLRFIMSTRFPNGLHEDYIVLALKETLTGLSVIHGSGHVHKEISAGHIFFNGKPEIKLAFSASVYEPNNDDQGQASSSSSSSLPSDSICNWAAAPEIYNSHNNEYTPKADIWLIGITALELAYGGVKVDSREALELKVKKINKEKKLPKKAKEEDRSKRKLLSPCISPFQCKSTVAFSKGFEKMVVKCLALKPDQRPSADELLQDELFAKATMNVILFHNLMRITRGME